MDLFISSDASICSTVTFPPCRNSDHVVVSVSINVQSNSKRDAIFHQIAYDFSCADSDGLHDHLRDVSLEDIFKLIASAAASEFCKCVQVGINVYTCHRKYQVKFHLSQCFPVPCAAAIVHRNSFFVSTNTNRTNLLNLK